MSRNTCFNIIAIVTIIFTILKLIYGKPTHPAPFSNNPNIPPSVYHGENQKYLTIPGINYYPPQPPPPPGFSSYGTHSYKDKSGVKTSDVKAGIALRELIKNEHHHRYYGIQTNQTAEQNVPDYHDMIRERYTTKIVPNRPNLKNLESYNILEMTNYITFDSKGILYSSKGDKTCIAIYNAKSLTQWHQKHVEDFRKKYPKSIFPIFRVANYTDSEKFTIYPGRVIHREPISVTCCGTIAEKLNLNFLTNGRHPSVNCITHSGFVPIRKLLFFKDEENLNENVDTSQWEPIELVEPTLAKKANETAEM